MEHKSRFYVRRKTSVPVADASILTDEGKTMEWLSTVVKLRSKFLFETTTNAATATVIRALESIRAKTRVVGKLRGKKNRLFVSFELTKYASWHKVAGVNRRCIRLYSKKGKVYKGKQRVIWLVAKYHKDEIYHVFAVRDMHFHDLNYIRDDSFYYIVASDGEVAREHAEKRREKNLRRYRGLAKASLGWLMHQVSGRSKGSAIFNKWAKRVYDSVNIARKQLMGNENNGGIGLYVLDGINYAVSAVDGGQGGVNDAIKRSINGIVGQINRAFEGKQAVKGWFEKKISCPFPEVKGSNKKG